ncbi:CAP-D2 condensin subunit isoform X2 [Rhodnius prolixus]|uniref:CAP-D2 condensin subunit isoform X2 n=1 Tax=Rhodnius prolixus TaxID=13249 RepID=UPI003D188A1B
MDLNDDWEFIIPLTKEDLLKSTSGQYSVENLIDWKTCLSSLKVLKDIGSFVREAILNEDPDSKREAVNVIKMNVYIFSIFEKAYEDKLSFNSENFISEPKRSKGLKTKTKSVKPEDLWDWNLQKKLAFTYIYEMLQQKLNLLWPSYVVEEALINLIANCCYKAFENPDVGQAKLKPLRDSVSQVLAVLVASYNHGITCIPKIVQLMKQFEQAVPAIASTAVLMTTEYKCTTIIPKILKELSISIHDDDVPGLAKSVATFITDIAEANPELLLPSVKALSRNLTVEPYVVRNASLIAFTEIILNCFSDGNISEGSQGTRDQLLRHLRNHLRDQNSYVRSKALQLWSKLAGARAIPKSYLMILLQSAKNRISDKSLMSAKSAIQLFTVVLKENPYAGRLNLTEMRGQLLQAKTILRNINAKRTLPKEEAWAHLEVDLILEINKYISNLENELEEEMVSTQSINISDVLLIIIKLLLEKHFVEAINLLKQSELQFPDAQEIRCNLDKNADPVEYYTAVFKKIFTKSADLPLEFDNFNEEYTKQKAVVDYIEESINFTILMNDVGKDINSILKSKSVMGVSEAIEFFTVAYQFGLADSRRVMRNILLLVRCDQPAIKEAVAAAYRKLYLTTCHKTARARALQIAQRLIKLLDDLDMEQKGALEDLVDLWLQNDELDKEFIQVLWEKFDKKDDQITEKESISALILLDMIAYKKPSLVSSNLQTVINAGFREHRDLMAVQYSCKMLSKISMIKKDGKCMRLPGDHELFEKIVNLVVINFNKVDIQGYKPMSLAAVTMISKTCCYPEKVLDLLLRKLYVQIFDSDGNMGDGDGDIFESQDSTFFSVKEALIERLLLIHGEILLRKWQYFNYDVVNMLAKSSKNQDNMQKEIDDEMDEFEAEYRDAEDDAIMNAVTQLCEELVTEEPTVNAHIRDVAIKVCTNVKEPYSGTLKAAAATTLAKYMMVSQAFCEDKIQLLVTLMEKSKEETVRGNLVLAIGDLLMRYPNVIEPWTPHLFTRLSDTSVTVRKNTVVVICHLVTREMVKVRGHVAEICLCLEDTEVSISEQVHSLFIDLARKGNTLYNIIPDIISRLSNPERSETITTEVFDRIMKFILGLIGKERQNELLVEKLCTRLCEATDKRQWRDLAFCLNQLNYNEKCLKKLIEALPHMNERLLCPPVHCAIVAIFNNVQKNFKQNLMEVANEGLAKIEELLTCKDKDGVKEGSYSAEHVLSPASTPLRTTLPVKLRSSKKPKKTRL